MTVIDAPALVLPAPFDTVEPGAHMEHGKRLLSWTLTGPGNLFRNRYAIAWVEISEREPWRGEPLSVWATRRVDMSAARMSFTDPGREAVAALLLEPVVRYGFDRLWVDRHGAGQKPSDALDAAARARREQVWWETKADLAEMHGKGLLSFRGCHTGADGVWEAEWVRRGRADSQRVVCEWGGNRNGWEEVSARVFLGVEPVGWVTRGGDLIPDGAILGA